MPRLKMRAGRFETNVHVTRDSRWAVFQSASEQGLYEVWAARVHVAPSYSRETLRNSSNSRGRSTAEASPSCTTTR